MQNKRQGEIVRYLSEVKFSKIEQLAEAFQISIETVRWDPLELGKESSIRRIRGGAMYNNLRAQEMESERKMEKHQMKKQAITKLASGYISDGDTIAMNNGTTSLAPARCLAERKNQLTVITSSSDVAIVLNENRSSNVYLISGYLRKHSRSLVGSMSSDMLGNFRMDKAIVSTDGISTQDGATEHNIEEAAVLKKMLEIGHTRTVLREFSKSSEMAFNKACSAKQADYVFTDWNISSKEVKAWVDIDVKVVATSQGNVEKPWDCQQNNKFMLQNMNNIHRELSIG